jgi:PAS domain S-box-containing protein
MNKLCKYLLFLILINANKPAKGKDKQVSLQLKWHHQFQFAGYYAAQLKGFYKEKGLEVSIIEGSVSRPPVTKVLNGEADFGITGSDVLHDFVQGKPVVITSVIFQHSPYVFIALKESNISVASDFYKKKVMVSDEQGWVLLKSLFITEGINLDSIAVEQHSWNNEDLIRGKVDAMSGYSTVEPYQLQQRGVQVSVINPIDYGLDFYGDLIFTSEDYANHHPETVKGFNEASARGWEYALNNKEEIINYILKLPGVKERGLTKEILFFEAEKTAELILPNLIEIGHINPGRFQRMLDLYKELKIVHQNVEIDKLIFKAEKLEWVVVWRKIGVAVSIIAALFILIFIWNRRLAKIVNRKTRELQKEIESRKLAESEARHHEQRLQLAIRSANIGLWNWDLDTRDVYLSKEWCEILNVGSSELPSNMNLFDLIHPEDLEATRLAFNDNLEGRKRKEMHQVRLLRPDGSSIYVLISFRAIHNDEGVAKKLFGVVINIDDIKLKEYELLKLSEELMHSNNELKKFAYITSHNLRGPIVNISSLMNMIDKADLNSDNTEIIDKIESSVLRLNKVLDDLIEIVSHQKPEAKKFSNIDFKKELDGVLQSIEHQVQESKASIISDFKVANVNYPKDYLESILLNLLTNAIKYRSEERPLIIHIHTTEDEQSIYLTIEDNGQGIDLDKNSSKIFGLYQRFHKGIEGKGMGLFIIKSHIESLKGSINVKSIPNTGTIFTVRFLKKS